jgi:hypothetical protein
MTNLLKTFNEAFSLNTKDGICKRITEKLNSDEFRFIRLSGEVTFPDGKDVIFSTNFNGKIVFCTMLPNIYHEIAHIIEIDKGRYLLDNFGLGGKESFSDPALTFKKFDLMTRREERVCAIQSIISNQDRGSKLKNSAWLEKFKPFLGKPDCPFYTVEEVKVFYKNYYEDFYSSLVPEQLEAEFYKRIDHILFNLRNSIKLAALHFLYFSFIFVGLKNETMARRSN